MIIRRPLARVRSHVWVSLSNLRTKPFTFFSLGLEALPALGGFTMDPNGAPAEGYGTAPGAEQ